MFGAILGGFSVLSGMYSAYQQSEAQRRGEDYQAQQAAMMKQQQDAANRNQAQLQRMNSEQMNAAATQYNQYQEIYGGIEENLANYYQNLSPDLYSAQMKDSITKQYEQSSQNLSANLAARGIQGSGVEAAGMTQLESDRMMGNAQADIMAPQMVAEQQGKFFSSVGQQQQQMANNNMQSAYNQQHNNGFNNVYNSFGNQANMAGNQAQNQFGLAGQYGQSAVQGISGGMEAIGNTDWSSKPSQFTQAELAIPSSAGYGGYGVDQSVAAPSVAAPSVAAPWANNEYGL